MNTTVNQVTRKKLFFFIDKHANTGDNTTMKAIESILVFTLIMVRACLSVRTTAHFDSAPLTPDHFFERCKHANFQTNLQRQIR